MADFVGHFSTPEMKDDGCNPCETAMADATITVTDAAGTQVVTIV